MTSLITAVFCALLFVAYFEGNYKFLFPALYEIISNVLYLPKAINAVILKRSHNEKTVRCTELK